MDTDQLRAYAYGVRDKRVSDDDPLRRVLPIGRMVKLAVDDLHDAADEIDRLRSEVREAQRVIDEAHGELDHLVPQLSGLDHGLIERIRAIPDL